MKTLDKGTCIHIITDDYAIPYFNGLFDTIDEAEEASIKLRKALFVLPQGVAKAVLDYCQTKGFDVNIGHDVYGLYRKERCFLPRIKALQRFAK